ncbi:3-hydroxyisobutyrate dehydrogenase [Corynebacterium sp.]|uniref:3-hydroxyisobutyrate dehydrogenase n=1 Tax=Corynebacterium sp. TaxID=1720 RepID=UPI00264974C5|nr:3-hydroxyisobutyrate dehydrogenase [Corynebacterium sp.]
MQYKAPTRHCFAVEELLRWNLHHTPTRSWTTSQRDRPEGTTMTTIGWIGTGNMGARMCANLVKAGFTVQAFDLNPDALAAAAENGATPVGSVAEVLDGADAVFTMLPKGQHVVSVFDGPEGIWANADHGTLLIDSSTIDPESCRTLHERSEEKGFHFVDAPVSGGISGAADGTLAFMMGGHAEDKKRAATYIEPMAGNIFDAGDATMGIAAKIANNMMLFIGVLATAEGSQLAESLGLDPKTFWEIASASSGRSWPQQTWYPVPDIIPTAASNRNFEGSFTVDLACKDVGLALDAGKAAGIDLRAAALACSQFDQLIDEGLAARDCTLIAKYVNPDGHLHGWDPAEV